VGLGTVELFRLILANFLFQNLTGFFNNFAHFEGFWKVLIHSGAFSTNFGSKISKIYNFYRKFETQEKFRQEHSGPISKFDIGRNIFKIVLFI
jgi:hypothetical protein